MDDKHAEVRDRKRRKAQYGMRVSGRSTKTVLLQVIAKKASQPERKRGRGSDRRS